MPLWTRLYILRLLQTPVEEPRSGVIPEPIYGYPDIVKTKEDLLLHRNEPTTFYDPQDRGLAMGSAYSPLLAVLALLD